MFLKKNKNPPKPTATTKTIKTDHLKSTEQKPGDVPISKQRVKLDDEIFFVLGKIFPVKFGFWIVYPP